MKTPLIIPDPANGHLLAVTFWFLVCSDIALSPFSVERLINLGFGCCHCTRAVGGQTQHRAYPPTNMKPPSTFVTYSGVPNPAFQGSHTVFKGGDWRTLLGETRFMPSPLCLRNSFGEKRELGIPDVPHRDPRDTRRGQPRSFHQVRSERKNRDDG